jgi:tetratricopeptide (TPR) repeat protein
LKPRWILGCVLPALSLIGCATPAHVRKAERAVGEYYSGDYTRASEDLRPLARKTDENFVLNNCRLGSVELTAYDLDEAEAAFYRAYEVINSVGVNNGGRTLGAVLVDEKIKVWKGEPYERAMANFYLGVIYYMRQDYNNARAAFENALFKLRDYADAGNDKDYHDVESNFAPAILMLAKSFQRLGRDDLAKANLDKVRNLRPELRELADYDRNNSSNLLLVVDFGYAPQKVTDFDGALVGFSPTPGQAGVIPEPRVLVDGRDLHGMWRPPVDLLALAQDRKWQSIDTIRAVKSALGTGLIAGGAVEGIRGANGHGARQRTDLMVAAGLIGSGLLLKATSQADVRQWEMLPRTTFILPLKAPPGAHDITVEFPHADGLRQTWRKLKIPDKGEATYYLRMQRWNPGPFDWPPPALARAGHVP